MGHRPGERKTGKGWKSPSRWRDIYYYCIKRCEEPLECGTRGKVTEPEKRRIRKTFFLSASFFPHVLHLSPTSFACIRSRRRENNLQKGDDCVQHRKDGRRRRSKKGTKLFMVDERWIYFINYEFAQKTFSYLSWALAFVDLPLRSRKTSSCRIRS